MVYQSVGFSFGFKYLYLNKWTKYFLYSCGTLYYI